MAKDLLLEIGTEEIPAGFIPGALEFMEDSSKNPWRITGLPSKVSALWEHPGD